MNRAEDALADCARALELSPRNWIALASRGYAHLQLGQFPEALRDLDASLAISTTYALTWFIRAAVRARLGDSDGALADLDQARRRDPRVDELAATASLTAPDRR